MGEKPRRQLTYISEDLAFEDSINFGTDHERNLEAVAKRLREPLGHLIEAMVHKGISAYGKVDAWGKDEEIIDCDLSARVLPKVLQTHHKAKAKGVPFDEIDFVCGDSRAGEIIKNTENWLVEWRFLHVSNTDVEQLQSYLEKKRTKLSERSNSLDRQKKLEIIIEYLNSAPKQTRESWRASTSGEIKWARVHESLKAHWKLIIRQNGGGELRLPTRPWFLKDFVPELKARLKK